ncbi:hypothetical protein [Comamonas odontotermitis]|uniref:hypothetical protein n=1 Tax=Comamonas TaxID=283 RepID=UPI001CC52836|nr:hypothetical protein [Comamonas odontotermitis]UBB15551.1 hypothetical protein LAD35_11755 [Comamonas odontotermitis]
MKRLNPLGATSALLAALLLAGCASGPSKEEQAAAAKAEEAKAEDAKAAEAAKPAPAPAVPQATAQFADAKANKFVQQSYATANGEGNSNFSVQFLKGNRVVYKAKADDGKQVLYRGTWKRTGNQIDVTAKDPKSDGAVNLSYEVRPELTSPAEQYKECKKFAPGLYPLNVNGSTDEDLSYSLWPEHMVKTNAAPCEPERKQGGKKRKHK